MSTPAVPPGPALVARLESARDRLDAVIAAVEGRDSCGATVDLLVSVSRDLNGVGFALVSNAMSVCTVACGGNTGGSGTDEHGSSGLTAAELEKLLLSLA